MKESIILIKSKILIGQQCKVLHLELCLYRDLVFVCQDKMLKEVHFLICIHLFQISIKMY